MRFFTLALWLGFSGILSAQQDLTDLPNFTSDQEWITMPAAPTVPDAGQAFGTPPASEVRAMAEWEELQALLITWRSHPAILSEIVRAAREECNVIIACNNQSTVSSATNELTSRGVDISSNVQFVVIPNNSIWVRDYGPNCVYTNQVDSLLFIDWIYNRTSRPLDNTLPEQLGVQMNIPVYATSTAPYQMVHTGGNFMSDGMGTAFSSKLIIEENLPGNPYGTMFQSEADINNIMSEFMGISRYIKMDALPYDVINHIDMHMKLLDEETLLVGQYPQGVSDGPQIEANIQYVLSNYLSPFNTPYKLVRVPMPPGPDQTYPSLGDDYRTYANAVFVNKTVIVPFYETQYDTTAQRIWEEAMPGYRIVGIDCNAIIPSLGAIHCITKEIGVHEPLRIVHQELTCRNNSVLPSYEVFATIQHRSGINSARVFYKTNLNPVWQSVDMDKVLGDTADVWMGTIPQQPDGATVDYYIEATAMSGKTITRPLPAPEGYWSFCTFSSVSTSAPKQAALKPIYPNPADAITCIPVFSEQSIPASVIVYNTFGQAVETVFKGMLPAGHSNHFINAGNYASGTYWVTLQSENGQQSAKLIVK